MKRICKRHFKVILKQFFFIAICVKLFFVCLLLVNKDPSSITSEDGGGHGADAANRWKFQNFNLEKWETNQLITLTDTELVETYFRPPSQASKRLCFVEGTNFTIASRDKCNCLPEYHGSDCGIPSAAWNAHFARNYRDRNQLLPRKKARRIIHGVLVNHEFDFFESRVKTLHDVVDVFIVQESNYSSLGVAKDLHFLRRFRDEGWLADQQHKFAYVPLTHFPKRGHTNGWFADAYIRRYLSQHGLRLIGDLRDDDLFLLLDADELPTREVLLFLKLYDGYTEPVRFGFRWTIFGFFWLKTHDSQSTKVKSQHHKERLLQLYVMCTVGMLDKVYGNNSMLLRRNMYSSPLLKERVRNYTKSGGHPIREWEIGTLGHYSGFHCSWCYSPEGIRTKLLSAQKHDQPRWGDYPEKTNVTYIRELIKSGGWFDGSKPFIEVHEDVQFYAPKYLMENRERFLYLLERPKNTVP